MEKLAAVVRILQIRTHAQSLLYSLNLLVWWHCRCGRGLLMLPTITSSESCSSTKIVARGVINYYFLPGKRLRAAPRKYRLNLQIAKKSNFSKFAQNEALRALVT